MLKLQKLPLLFVLALATLSSQLSVSRASDLAMQGEPEIDIDDLTDDLVRSIFGDAPFLVRQPAERLTVNILFSDFGRSDVLISRRRAVSADATYPEDKRKRFFDTFSDWMAATASFFDETIGVQVVFDNNEESQGLDLWLLERKLTLVGHPRWRTWRTGAVSFSRGNELSYAQSDFCGALTEWKTDPFPRSGHYVKSALSLPTGYSSSDDGTEATVWYWTKDFCAARPQGFIATDAQGNFLSSRCALVVNFQPDVVKSAVLECLLRGLGFLGVSELFPSAAIGERLPHRADFFLGGESVSGRNAYERRLPKAATAVDAIYLKILYSDLLRPGMTKQEARPVVRDLLQQYTENLILLEGVQYD